MSHARLLDQRDVDQFKNLINRRFHAKEIKAPDADQKFLEALNRSGKTNTRVYGYFDQSGELLSATCQVLWQQMPYYTLIWGLIHPKFSSSPFNVSAAESGFRDSVDAAIKYAESIDRFTFFYGMTLRNLKVRRDIWLQEDSYLSLNYDGRIETVIKSGEYTEYEPWKLILGYQLRKQDIVIKVCRKKPELLYKELCDRGLLNIDYNTLYKTK